MKHESETYLIRISNLFEERNICKKKKNLNKTINRYSTKKTKIKTIRSRKNNRARERVPIPTNPRDIRNRRVNNPEGGSFSGQKQAPSTWRSTPFENNVVSPAKKRARGSLVKRSLSRCETGRKKGGCFPRSAPRFQSKV